MAPFFSPNSDRIGFVKGNSLVTQRFDGGDRRTVVPDLLRVFAYNAVDWSADGHIVYVGRDGRLMIVDQDGLTPPRVLTEPGEAEAHRQPRFLDQGSLVAFSVTNAEDDALSRVEVINTQSGENNSLDVGPCAEVRYVEEGFLLCSVGSDIHAIPFDLKPCKPKGRESPFSQG